MTHIIYFNRHGMCVTSTVSATGFYSKDCLNGGKNLIVYIVLTLTNFMIQSRFLKTILCSKWKVV